MIGSSIMAFGLYNVHSLSGVTEGGILGMTLLLNYWLDLSPAITGFIMNAACYLVGWKLLGWSFILYSTIAGFTFSASYAVFEQFPRLWPGLADMPLTAAIVGALFIGIGAGLCVRAGGAPSGDDALAMSICRVTKSDIRIPYLASDLLVLALSLSYLDLKRIAVSLLTVVLSGQLIGFVQNARGAPGGGIKRAERTTAWIFSPSTQNFSSLWVLGGFFCSGIQSLCIFLIFHEKNPGDPGMGEKGCFHIHIYTGSPSP